jgi:flagellar biogenesis protein FliO
LTRHTAVQGTLAFFIAAALLAVSPSFSQTTDNTANQEQMTGTAGTAGTGGGENGPASESAQMSGGDTEAPDAASDGPGAEAEDGQGPYQYEDPDFGETQVSYPMMVLRTIAIMGVVIIGLYVLYRFVLKKKNRVAAESNIINVLATYPLAANRVIQVVDIAGQILVLGVADASVNLITRIDDQETIDRIKLLSSQEKKGGAGFKEQLFKLLGGGLPGSSQSSGNSAARGLQPGSLSSLNSYKKRINRMRNME